MITSIKEELLRSGNIMFSNKGTSMKPLLRQGKDLIIIETKKSNKRFKKFDTVLFERDNGELVLHRITDVLKDGYLILGDNCIAKEYVKEGQILGLMTAFVRDGKKRIDVRNKSYLRYVHFWYSIYPVRKFLLRVKNKLKV